MAIHYTGIVPAAAALVYVAALAYMLLRRDIETSAKLVKRAAVLTIVGWLIYWIPFATLDYSLREVFWNTSPGLPLWMRLASAWAGGGGSLYLFATISAIATLYVTRGLAEAKKQDILVMGAAAVTLAAIVSAFANGAFSVMDERPASGAGLNPLLKSPWLYPHPLSTFGGYALLAVGMLALLAGLRRRGFLAYELGWALLTLGIMIGGYWSYETFGWGGYWAWDPVETSELMVWLAATLLPHAMVAVPSLVAFTEYLTLSSVFLGMYVTRSGLSPLHSFAAANIGVLVLLAVALVTLFLAFRRLGEFHLPSLENVRRSPFRASILIAAIALFAATVFIYATLLLPSVLTAVGYEASVPQMQSGVRYFHPVLYPLLVVMLAAIPLAFTGDKLGWKGYTALLLTTATVSILAGLAALQGSLVLAPLSSKETNALMAFGLPWAGLAAAATILYMALRLRSRGSRLAWERMTGISLLHLGLAVVVIGVLLSGTYSFNEAYFIDASLKPGEPLVLPNGVKIELVDYRFELSNSMVDIYTGYAGRATSYFLAWNTLAMLASDYGQKVKQALEAEKLLEANETLRTLVELAVKAHISAIRGNITITSAANVTGIDLFTGDKTPIAENINITMELVNPRVMAALEPLRDNLGRVKAAKLRIYISADEAIVAGLPGSNITARTVLDIGFADPVKLVLGNTSFEISQLYLLATGHTGHPAVERRGNTFAYKPVVVIPSGRVEVEGYYIANPLDVPASLAAYIESRRDLFLRRLLNSSLAEILGSDAVVKAMNPPGCKPVAETPHGGCFGYVDVPRMVPETAWLILDLRIERGDKVREESVRLRFESYGEVQGIHGLVTKVVHPRVGLTDIYIAIHAPVVAPKWGVAGYHELLVYYLHAVYQSMNLTPAQRIALAALMASGYMMDTALSINDPAQRGRFLEQAALELYLLAESFNPRNTTIARQGLPVQVKLVPGVALVWYGTVIMAASAVYTAIIAAYTARKGRA